jgi:DNA repair protein RadC
MTDREIVKALALLVGSRRKARRLLARTTIRHLANAQVEELKRFMPGRIARRFHAAVRVAKHAIAPERSASIELRSAAYAHVYPFFVGRETERFVSVVCDIRYKVIATEVIAEGLPDAVDVRIADIFALAIRHRAVALLVAHNHPSGDPTPSEYDYALTKDLLEAGELLGVRVIDHLVVAGTSYRSIHDECAKKGAPCGGQP